ncbi:MULTISPECIES: S4 domain-containing protein YaaA [Lacticaseibacillus]|jgi:S4 domain protein YaaA|uniref:S4 domain-containing protein YaaA n=1 Tax=Lacticaseibacillus TaxID=2759736 RepID=UPI000F78EFE0|nr:S4 domain-containing protein YaaA [Lacticaseibacillus porcinae]
MATVEISTEYITLGQLLKDAGIIDSGGQAKWFLAENRVLVNGEEDSRRGRKLRAGDTATLPDNTVITVVQAG